MTPHRGETGEGASDAWGIGGSRGSALSRLLSTAASEPSLAPEGSAGAERSAASGRPARVLLALDGLPREGEVIARLALVPEIDVVRRCVDVVDLLASARVSGADAAWVSSNMHRWSPEAADHLDGLGIKVLALTEARRTSTCGAVPGVLDVAGLEPDEVVSALLEWLHAEVRGSQTPERSSSEADLRRRTSEGQPLPGEELARPGRVIAVCGTGGAPGRTATAIAIADESARRGVATTLIDADSRGPSIAASLAFVDGISGLSALCRLVERGHVSADDFAEAALSLDSGLRVLTGVNRAQRWAEIRISTLLSVIALSRQHSRLTVVDLCDAAGLDGARERAHRSVLEAVDEIVVVAAADPVGLVRLSGVLADLERDHPEARLTIVVNKLRPGVLGRRPDEIVREVLGDRPHHLIADDRAAFDVCLRDGRTLGECAPRSAARRDLAVLAQAMVPDGNVSGHGAQRSRSRLGRGAHP